jgi:hypothetical protein
MLGGSNSTESEGQPHPMVSLNTADSLEQQQAMNQTDDTQFPAQ